MKIKSLFLALVACACSATPADPIGSQRQSIIGGNPSTSADDAVLLMYTQRAASSVCSAVLIAPNLVLTARHCISTTYPTDDIMCNPDGTPTSATGGGQLDAPTKPSTVSFFSGLHVSTDSNGFPGGTVVAQGKQIIAATGPSVCKDDIALVVLDRALDQTPVPLGLGLALAPEQLVSVVGYGLTATTPVGSIYDDRHRRDNVAVKYVGILPNTFTLGRSVCKGDSGGPAFDPAIGAVLGVYSLGFPGSDAASCSSEEELNYFVEMSRYEDLLHQAFDAAGQPYPSPIVADGGVDAGADADVDAADGDAGGDPGNDAGSAETGGTGGAGTSNAAGASSSKNVKSSGCQVSAVGGGPSWPLVLLAAAAVGLRRRKARS